MTRGETNVEDEYAMDAREFFELVARQYADKPDDHVLSLGDWREDPVLGAPHQEFNALMRLTLGEVRQMAQIKKKDMTMSDLIPLGECPPGLFLFEGNHSGRPRLGFKNDYGEYFVVASGEVFWGGAKSTQERAALLVRPIDADAMTAAAQGML